MSIAHSNQYKKLIENNDEIPDNVDLETFKELAQNCLGAGIDRND